MFITATGMVCAVGLNAAAACAAKRVGIQGFNDLPYNDNAGEPIVGAAVPGLDPNLRGAARLLELLKRCLADVTKGQPAGRWEQVPLLVGLAEQGRPGGGAELADSVVKRAQEALGVRFHPQHSRALAAGNTAGFELLRVARQLLEAGAAATCLVCGVDSLVNAVTLLSLDRDFRLKTAANRDGVIPGEAAAAVVLQKAPDAGAVAEMIGLGFAKEPAPILSEGPLLGLGLAEAARAALAEAKLGLHEIEWRSSDVSGELYGFKELQLVTARVMRVVRHEDQPLWHWAEAIGDSGAAAGVAQLVLADAAFRKGYAPGDRMIGFTCSAPGDRAAAVLRRQSRDGGG
jgi:3-oxoacyl-[acyl-carrier-protein] synthase-1